MQRKDLEYYFAIYEKELKRYRDISDDAWFYFKTEMDKRFPHGDFLTFLEKSEKLNTDQIKTVVKEAGYQAPKDIPPLKKYTLTEMQNLIPQSGDDLNKKEPSSKDTNIPIIDDSAWTKPQKLK